jgi:hypothetical protein
MSTALAEPAHAAPTNNASTRATSAAQKDASRANGRLSRGPTSPEGKARSRQNGCKEGLTGAGIVLPPAAAAEVARREAEFAHDLRPKSAVERELVRQMALGAWRSHELGMRIVRHDARMNAERFANWEQDEQIAAAEIGRRLADDPEAAVAQLQRSSAGCDWMIRRWTLLANALSTADEGGAVCTWTDADVSLALDLLGCRPALRHLNDWTVQLESLRGQAQSGVDEAVAELREMVANEVAELEKQREEVWEGVEQPRLQDWCSGVDMDLGPEGTRLRRYEAAADRLFRSAWTKLERLRNERGEPLMPRSERGYAPEPAPRPLPIASAPTATGTLHLRPDIQALSRLLEADAGVHDFWAAGAPGQGIGSSGLSQNKTNPAPTRPARGERGGIVSNHS